MDKTHFDFNNENTDFGIQDEDCKYFSVSQYFKIVKNHKFFNQLAFVDLNMKFFPKNKLKINSFLGQLSDDWLPAIITITETELNNANAKSVNIKTICSNTLTHFPMLEV